MRWKTGLSSALVVAGLVGSARGAEVNAEVKDAVVIAVDRRRPELIGLAGRIWSYAEPALLEIRSSRDLADYAERQGFRVERGAAGLPTAFVASFGVGRPVVGILGEYDALPGLSQKAQPTKEPVTPGAPGHGCGHNLFGPASLGAAVAVKEQIAAGRIKGTVRFFGCPAEETLIGKVYMARAGLFDDLDACLAWHPAFDTGATTEATRAMVDFIVEFRGKTAHASTDPWNGRSALDGLELFTHGLNMLREHVKPSVRIHYVIAEGGKVPNIVPNDARLWCWVRDVNRVGVEDVMKRVRKMAEGAGLMADVEAKLTVQTGVHEMLVNRSGSRLLHANVERFGPIAYTDEEINFALALQREAGVRARGIKGDIRPLKLDDAESYNYSTDVAEVSWIVPTLHLNVTTAPENVSRHAWPTVASSGMSIGHKGMIRAAEVLAATMIDLFQDESARKAIRAEFREATRGFTYKPLIPDGPPPLPAPPP